MQGPDLCTRQRRYLYLGKEEIDVGGGECAAEQLGVAAQLGKLAALHVFHVLRNSNSSSTPNVKIACSNLRRADCDSHSVHVLQIADLHHVQIQPEQT